MNVAAIPVTLLQAAVQGSALATLKPGMVLQGLVLGLAGDGMLRLQLPGGALEVKAMQTLPAGTRVQVAVEGSAAQPKLVLTPLPASNAAGAGAPISAATAAATSPAGALPVSTMTPAAQVSLQQVMQTVVAAAVREAIGRQAGVAPLMADLEAALARAGDALPPPVRAAAVQLLATRLDVRGSVDAGTLRSALLASGLAAAARPDGGAPAPDLNAALTRLRQALSDWLGREPVRVTNMPQAASSPAPENTRAAAPPPPHRNAPPAAQPAAPASLAPQADAEDVGAHLLARTEAAIARQTLLQAASLPDPSPGETGKTDAATRLVLDVPLLAPQGNAAAQIRIERDEGRRGRDGDDMRPAWRASFSLDLEPIGPVHAQVTVVGETAHVALFAERGDSAAALRDNVALLQAGLADAAIEPGDIRCAAGTPAAPAAAPGLFVDRAS